jgi:ABC-type bacteriocin/lantibiotic exporter with double-glycine peptidase domain
MVRLPMAWHQDRISGECIDRIHRASQGLHGFSATLFQPVYTIVRFLGAMIAIAIISPTGALCALVISSIAFTVVRISDRLFVAMRSQVNQAENRVTGRLFDFLSNIGTILTLRLGNGAQHELKRNLFVALPTVLRQAFANELKWWSAHCFVVLLTVCAMGYTTYWDLQGDGVISIVVFYLLWEYLQRIGNCFFNAAGVWATLVNNWTDFQGVRDILDADEEFAGNAVVPTTVSKWRTLEVQNLSFRFGHDESTPLTVESLSFTMERGKRYAIIGESGSGKSTLLRLLRGMYEPTEGVFSIDGNIVSPSVVQGLTTLMPQDPEVFTDSIKANVSFWMEHHDDRIDRALEVAGFANVLEKLPRGAQTNVAEKGVNLSGGERQRLALARGIYFAGESPIILLDEPTSSVDPSTERDIYEGIISEFPDAIIVSSLHKLHLLDLFDEVFTMERGRLVNIARAKD